MEPLELVIVLLCVLLGLGRGADLAFATDVATGLCTTGAVWWRYLALGAVVLTAVLVGRSRPLPEEPWRSRRPAAGVLAFAGAVCMLAAGAAQFVFAAGTVSTFVRILLEVACAVWLSNLGRSWLRRDGWKTPAGGLPVAIAGSALFYWNVLMRFMENSSSWHRVQPTAAVWQEMAALLRQVTAVLAEAGWTIVNVDATVAAQAPKLAPYIPEMRERLAAAMGLDAGCVSVKATTEEGLGFTGSGEGIAAHAAALVEKTA